jgi:hypothetical protein
MEIRGDRRKLEEIREDGGKACPLISLNFL